MNKFKNVFMRKRGETLEEFCIRFNITKYQYDNHCDPFVWHEYHTAMNIYGNGYYVWTGNKPYVKEVENQAEESAKKLLSHRQYKKAIKRFRRLDKMNKDLTARLTKAMQTMTKVNERLLVLGNNANL